MWWAVFHLTDKDRLRKGMKSSKQQSQDHNLILTHPQVRVLSSSLGWFLNFFKKENDPTAWKGKEASMTRTAHM